ncbi:MAG: hypothetical protein ACRD8W_09320 [Nitrososphaeraceae archaeon]
MRQILQEFIGKVVNEWRAAEGALLTLVGNRLGLFKAMAGACECTAEELEKKSGDASTNNNKNGLQAKLLEVLLSYQGTQFHLATWMIFD